MNRHLRAVAISILLASMVGCIPVFRSYPKLPAVSGVVSVAGAPLSNAEVRLSTRFDASSCGTEAPVATTLLDGSFEFPGKSGFFYLLPLLPGTVDSLMKWRLCFGKPGREPEVWPYSFTGPQWPEAVSVTCDLASAAELCTIGEVSW